VIARKYSLFTNCRVPHMLMQTYCKPRRNPAPRQLAYHCLTLSAGRHEARDLEATVGHTTGRRRHP
jgi:hypothetical protein